MRSVSGSACSSSRPARGRAAVLAAACLVALVASLALPAARALAGSPDPVLERWRVERIRLLGPVVRSVRFVGNEAFGERELLQYLRTRPGGPFRAVHYSRGTLDRDLANLERFYESQGFPAAKAGLEDVAPSADGLSVELLISVDEGGRWTVSSIALAGNRALDDAALRGLLSLREGDPLLADSLAHDRSALLDEYARRSFLDARVEQVVERDDALRTASVRYRIVERVPAVIASAAIEGTDKTRDFVLEREFLFAPGRPFDVDEIGETQAALYRTGLFNSIRIEPAAADTGLAERRLLVRVRERPSVRVDLTGGYAVLDGYEAGLEIVNRNVQGQAVTAAVRGRVSEFAREAEATVGDPWFLGVRLSAAAGVRYAWSDEEAFTAETAGVDATVSRLVGRAVTVQAGYTFERTVVLETAEEGGDLGDNYTSDVSVGATLDTRDDILNARRGVLAGASVDVASSKLGGTNDFVRTELFARGFVPAGRRAVGAVSLRFGWIEPEAGGSVPVNERYTAGGDGSVRGFARNSLGPRGAEGGTAGGLAVLEVRAEARVRVWKGLSAVAFADAGQAFEDAGAVGAAGLAVGAGGGLRYDTRIGVIRFDLAAPVTEDGRGAAYFGVGQAF